MALSNFQAALFPDAPPPNGKPAHGEHLTFKANRDRGRHGWLRLTPAYSVHLVEQLIANFDQDARVLDPFCGTGTTALVCAQAGIPCHTVDVNPFLVWLANVKCANYSACDIEQVESVLARALAAHEATRDVWIPPIKDIHKWWESDVLLHIADIFDVICHADVSESARNLLLVIFCRTIIELASVSFGHQSMSFKKSSAAPTLFALPTSERVQLVFRRAGDEILTAARDFAHLTGMHVLLGDSRRLDTVLPRADYTAVITSPPYPNRMSYIRELRPYMYWLGYLETGRQAGEMDWQAIGGTWGCATSNLLTWTPDTLYPISSSALAEAVEAITARSKVLGIYVTKYFHDMVPHLRSLRAVLAPGAQAHYIVGNSKFYDVMLPTELIYAAMLADVGFHDIGIETIRKRTSKKELYEFIVSARA